MLSARRDCVSKTKRMQIYVLYKYKSINMRIKTLTYK